MKKKLVFFDAETDGLYGDFISVGMLAVDENGEEIEREYCGIKKENLQLKDEWTIANVLPRIGEYCDCENESELLDRVWAFWMKYREDAYAIADVPYPVECRLFQKCVEKDLKERAMSAPYPLLDLSSILLAAGVDPLASRIDLMPENTAGNVHNAIFDVEMSKEIFMQIQKGENCGRK